MSSACDYGHSWGEDGYCDVCGVRNPAGATGSASTAVNAVRARLDDACPDCGTPREGRDRYCANCAYDFETGEALRAPIPLPTAVADPVHLAGMAAVQPGRAAVLVRDGSQSRAPEPAPVSAPPPVETPTIVLMLGVDSSRFGEPGCPPIPPDLTPRVFAVDRPMVIGRHSSGGGIVTYGDPYVSRRHAEIIRVGDGWGIRDLNSANGTKVNGVQLQGAEVRILKPEDVIEIGFFTRITVR
jgi:hypothetical protein